MKKTEIETLVSQIATRLEREFIFYDIAKGPDTSKHYLASECFVVPPAKGEFFATKDAVWEIISVTHIFESSKSPGVIWVKKHSSLDDL